MIDHVGIRVSSYATSKAFYERALAPLGYTLLVEIGPEYGGAHAGFGQAGKPDFWISEGTPSPGLHVAIQVQDRAAVDAFYEAALAAGAKDNGPPGLRPHYHPNYYGAFVLAPDGVNLEAVCHRPS